MGFVALVKENLFDLHIQRASMRLKRLVVWHVASGDERTLVAEAR